MLHVNAGCLYPIHGDVCEQSKILRISTEIESAVAYNNVNNNFMRSLCVTALFILAISFTKTVIKVHTDLFGTPSVGYL